MLKGQQNSNDQKLVEEIQNVPEIIKEILGCSEEIKDMISSFVISYVIKLEVG